MARIKSLLRRVSHRSGFDRLLTDVGYGVIPEDTSDDRGALQGAAEGGAEVFQAGLKDALDGARDAQANGFGKGDFPQVWGGVDNTLFDQPVDELFHEVGIAGTASGEQLDHPFGREGDELEQFVGQGVGGVSR